MSNHTDVQDRQLHLQRAQHVFQEMLTATSPDVRQALESLYELVKVEISLSRCQCEAHSES
ncbi:MAG: hypothetical protein U0931_39275 [Vulcanimicrobiota bacterium]